VETRSAARAEVSRHGISVITATRNASGMLANLYRSLAAQEYSNFEWIVADGGSCDGTVTLLQELAHRERWISFVSEPDGGIYHALNKAIARASGDYYVVAGADDLFERHALSNYAEAVSDSEADVIFARVIRAGRVTGGFRPGRAWIGPSRVFRSSHSIGTLFRKDLHRRFGPYSSRFPLLADVYFLKTLLRSGSVRFSELAFIAGTFADGGATSVNQLQLLAENWQIQMLTEPFPLVQMVLFLGKLVLRYPRLTSELRAGRRSLAFKVRT
jgi:glycosyltransferase involved in cell wall biosynthesis